MGCRCVHVSHRLSQTRTPHLSHHSNQNHHWIRVLADTIQVAGLDQMQDPTKLEQSPMALDLTTGCSAKYARGAGWWW